MSQTFDLGHAKILVVDDIAINRMILCEIINRSGGKTVKANDGIDAVRKFCSSAPGEISLILMDISMPKMNGREATALIRSSEHPDAGRIPIIAVTAESAEEEYNKCMECGMNYYIHKPFDTAELLQAIVKLTV